MPTYTDEAAKPKVFTVLPEGVYIVQVKAFGKSYSKGAKTSGCPQYDFEFEVEGKGVTLKESIIDHESTIWRALALAKSCVDLKKGESFEFEKTKAEEQNVRWLNPIGWRCYAQVSVEEFTYQKGSKVGQTGKANRIVTFLMDRPRLEHVKQSIEDADVPSPEEF